MFHILLALHSHEIAELLAHKLLSLCKDNFTIADRSARAADHCCSIDSAVCEARQCRS
jgi:hypothetical protein